MSCRWRWGSAERSAVGKGWLVGVGILALLAIVPTASANEVDYGVLVVRNVSEDPGTLHGYREFRFELASRSPRDHAVTLRIPGRQIVGSLLTLERLERTVHLPAYGEASVRIHQPPLRLAGAWLEVSIDGTMQPETVSVASDHPTGWNSGGGKTLPRVLVSRALAELADDDPAPLEDLAVPFARRQPVEQWSPHWLAYTGWDGIVLSNSEARSAPRPVADALMAFARAGGPVWIVGESLAESPLPAPWPGGDCVEKNGVTTCAAGFGWVYRTDWVATGLEGGSRSPLVKVWNETMGAWALTFDPALAHRVAPVVEKIGVPVRGLFLLLVGFTILVGPINIIWLSRRGRRLWILGTIPLISGLACGALLLAVLFGEGIVRQRRLDAVTWLDQPAQQASSIAWAGYYSTLVPRQGLRFAADTEVTLFRDLGNWQLNRKRPGKQVVWDDAAEGEQHLGRGWIRPRVPTYLMLRKSEPRSERLDVQAHTTAVSVVNGLGADIESLWLADGLGQLWSAGSLAAGERTDLQRRDGMAEGSISSQRRLYRGEIPAHLRSLDNEPEKILRPGTYLVSLRSNPFVEPGFADATGRENTWVLGRWLEPDDTPRMSPLAAASGTSATDGPTETASARLGNVLGAGR